MRQRNNVTDHTLEVDRDQDRIRAKEETCAHTSRDSNNRKGEEMIRNVWILATVSQGFYTLCLTLQDTSACT